MVIAVDYSLNSPGMTIQHNNGYHFFNFFHSEKTIDKIINGKSLEGKILKEIIKLNDLTIVQYNRGAVSIKEYTEKEVAKLEDAVLLADLISNELDKFKEPKIGAAFEGYSYGSKGNSALDLASAVSILRMDLYFQTEGNLKIFSPKQIKKLSGNGNANKIDMYNAFINNTLKDSLLDKSQFWNWIINNQNLVVKYKKNTLEIKEINKPFDDIIDSYFILQMLKKSLSS